MSDPKARGYFGPRRNRPATVPGTRALKGRATRASPLRGVASPNEGEEDCFPAFNLETDIQMGHFVALSVEQEELRTGIPFYVGKVLESGKGR